MFAGGVSDGRRIVIGRAPAAAADAPPADVLKIAIDFLTLLLLSIGSASPRLIDVCANRSSLDDHAGGELVFTK